MALPDDLKYVKARIFGLPETLVPFSPGDLWKDPRLEELMRLLNTAGPGYR